MNLLPLTRSPWRLGGLEVQHRVVMGSMHTGLEVADDGGAALAEFYRERVIGGAALVITGGLAVSSVGRGGPDYGVLTDQRSRWQKVTDSVHEAGGLISAQLFHAGRYALSLADADGPMQAVAPSAVPWSAARGAVPRQLSGHEVLATIEDFARAASVAREVGFDAVEIMASEGYLINQFCSPLTNLRDDEWGGDAARRRRFAVETLRAVRAAVGDLPVLVRMSGADLMPGSSTQEETDDLARSLVPRTEYGAGVDGLSVGVGWHESRVPTVQASVPHGAWLVYAERIAAVVDGAVPVIASNRLTDLRDVEAVLSRGDIAAVALARPFLADPRIVERSFAEDFGAVNSCIGCNQACIDRSLVFEPVSCLVNPRAARETRYPLVLETRRSVAVVGAGPAGLAAAADLHRRGHAVTLFDADEPGGQFALAARIPGKEDYALTVSAALTQLAGSELRFGTLATADDLADFDGVIVATGVVPRRVDIPGADLPHVLSYERALREGVPPGTVAIIGGGGIGVDVAAYLVESHDERTRAVEFSARFDLPPTDHLARVGHTTRLRPGSQVTVLRRSGRFGAGIGISSRWVALGRLRDHGVSMRTDLGYRRITADGVEIETAEGIEMIPGRTVIVCAGQERNDSLVPGLVAAGIRHLVVGGARDATGVDAVRATAEALAAAREITRA
ncbi:FAD-dependent oxidoreductase [Lacisediminihabitans changchengi]|uniref:FAD-dependent oxidoreductase n=1 Tax=Lacisediminihabitans changchengi TaxID=2787634 RepID=A0A934SGD6_9MICO|nr:FAD-dependent oxidoreductase [Lacisediminihabitans changchengi]MBK4346177.1 FAD-dependent oxidoreductase [Lacisediminihabitans changchengi]